MTANEPTNPQTCKHCGKLISYSGVGYRGDTVWAHWEGDHTGSTWCHTSTVAEPEPPLSVREPVDWSDETYAEIDAWEEW